MIKIIKFDARALIKDPNVKDPTLIRKILRVGNLLIINAVIRIMIPLTNEYRLVTH